jgi:hypothetical protein
MIVDSVIIRSDKYKSVITSEHVDGTLMIGGVPFDVRDDQDEITKLATFLVKNILPRKKG